MPEMIIIDCKAARIRRKTEVGGRVRFLDDAEEIRLCAAIGDRFKEFLPHLLLFIHTGMRMSEQYGLDWSHADLNAGRSTFLKPRTEPHERSLSTRSCSPPSRNCTVEARE